MCLDSFLDQQQLQEHILPPKPQWFLPSASFHNPDLSIYVPVNLTEPQKIVLKESGINLQAASSDRKAFLPSLMLCSQTLFLRLMEDKKQIQKNVVPPVLTSDTWSPECEYRFMAQYTTEMLFRYKF